MCCDKYTSAGAIARSGSTWSTFTFWEISGEGPGQLPQGLDSAGRGANDDNVVTRHRSLQRMLAPGGGENATAEGEGGAEPR